MPVHPDPTPSDLSDRLATRLDTHGITASAVGLFYQGHLIAQHQRGLADRERQQPITAATRFRLCSLTKQFTAELTLRCAEQGMIALDAPLTAFGRDQGLPWAPRAPSLRQLLSGLSGVRDHWATLMICGYRPEDQTPTHWPARDWQRLCSLQFEPGTQFCYSNTAYHLAAQVLEQASGQSFLELLQERLLEPLGLESLYWAADTGANEPALATGYEGERVAKVAIRWGADAALTGTIGAFEPWERYCAEKARLDPEEGLYQPIRLADGTRSSYGLGVRYRQVQGTDLYYHGGALRGFRCARVHDPAAGYSVVLLANDMIDAENIALAILADCSPDTPSATPHPTVPNDALTASTPNTWLHAPTGLAAVIEDHTVRVSQLRFAVTASTTRAAAVTFDDGTRQLRLQLPDSGIDWTFAAVPEAPAQSHWIEHGLPRSYRCDALTAELIVTTDAHGMPSAQFSIAGRNGERYPMLPLGRDLWHLPCERALDHPAPGCWTLSRDPATDTLRLSTWLSRDWHFTPVRD
ncbi:MAG: serine hydrolase [Pseudomonadota bacterium]